MADVLVAVISAAGLLAVALVANRGRQHAKAARQQVQNSHETNLRDDFDEMKAKIDTLIELSVAHEERLTRIEGRPRIRRIFTR